VKKLSNIRAIIISKGELIMICLTSICRFITN